MDAGCVGECGRTLAEVEALMPAFSGRSIRVLNTVRSDLQDLMREVVKHFDCTILPDGGIRTPQKQAELLAAGATKTLHSKHLTGEAVDVAPWPLKWPDEEGISKKERHERYKVWYAFCGFVKATAVQMGINVRGGFDWDSDWMFTDQQFHDLPHWELM